MEPYGYYLVIAFTFLFAGMVKGVVGMGLPTICLAIFTVAIDLKSAMALLLVPSLVTNLYQAVSGGNGKAIIRKCGVFLLLAGALVGLGTQVLDSGNMDALSLLLGVLLIGYALSGITGIKLLLSGSQQLWAGPVAGVLNGVLTGMTGSFVVPGVLYLQSIGLDRNQLVQAMGILFTISTVCLGLSLSAFSLVSSEIALHSLLGVVPAILGMMLGSRVRRGLSEQRFRTVFFLAVLLLGLSVIAGALPALLQS